MDNTNTLPLALLALKKIIKKGDTYAFPLALEAMLNTKGYRKRWQEDVLGDVLSSDNLNEHYKKELTLQLLACKSPPRDHFFITCGHYKMKCMAVALRENAFDAMLPLYRAGFELPKEEFLTFASKIGIGLWPHPEILMPDILVKDINFNRLLYERIFTHEGMTLERVDQLNNLTQSNETKRRFGSFLSMIAISNYDEQRNFILGNRTKLLIINRLVELDMMDTSRLFKDKDASPFWQQIQAKLQEITLEENTSPVKDQHLRLRGLRL